MKWCKQWLIPALLMLAVVVTPAYAQSGGTSSITGNVTDNSGGVIPGASITAVDASGVKYETVSNSQGGFTIPSLTPGTYKVTVTLQGFKTFVAENVRVAVLELLGQHQRHAQLPAERRRDQHGAGHPRLA